MKATPQSLATAVELIEHRAEPGHLSLSELLFIMTCQGVQPSELFLRERIAELILVFMLVLVHELRIELRIVVLQESAMHPLYLLLLQLALDDIGTPTYQANVLLAQTDDVGRHALRIDSGTAPRAEFPTSGVDQLEDLFIVRAMQVMPERGHQQIPVLVREAEVFTKLFRVEAEINWASQTPARSVDPGLRVTVRWVQRRQAPCAPSLYTKLAWVMGVLK